MDPNSVRPVSYKRREVWTGPHAEGRWPREDETELRGKQSRPRNTSRKAPQAGKGRKGASCEASSWESPASTLISPCQTLGLCEHTWLLF